MPACGWGSLCPCPAQTGSLRLSEASSPARALSPAGPGPPGLQQGTLGAGGLPPGQGEGRGPGTLPSAFQSSWAPGPGTQLGSPFSAHPPPPPGSFPSSEHPLGLQGPHKSDASPGKGGHTLGGGDTGGETHGAERSLDAHTSSPDRQTASTGSLGARPGHQHCSRGSVPWSRLAQGLPGPPAREPGPGPERTRGASGGPHPTPAQGHGASPPLPPQGASRPPGR